METTIEKFLNKMKSTIYIEMTELQIVQKKIAEAQTDRLVSAMIWNIDVAMRASLKIDMINAAVNDIANGDTLQKLLKGVENKLMNNQFTSDSRVTNMQELQRDIYRDFRYMLIDYINDSKKENDNE